MKNKSEKEMVEVNVPLKEEVCDFIDKMLNKTIDLTEAHFKTDIGAELFICLQQLAIEIAIQGSVSEKDFLTTASQMFQTVRAEKLKQSNSLN